MSFGLHICPRFPPIRTSYFLPKHPGFMNTRSDDDASWMASMWSMSSEGTRAGPHCQWSLNPDDNGEFEGGVTRAQMVEKILKTLIVLG